jgi:hypothetical protein
MALAPTRLVNDPFVETFAAFAKSLSNSIVGPSNDSIQRHGFFCDHFWNGCAPFDRSSRRNKNVRGRRSIVRLGIRRLIGKGENAGAEDFRVGELEPLLRGAFGKEALAAANDDRVHQKVELIEEVILQEQPND